MSRRTRGSRKEATSAGSSARGSENAPPKPKAKSDASPSVLLNGASEEGGPRRKRRRTGAAADHDTSTVPIASAPDKAAKEDIATNDGVDTFSVGERAWCQYKGDMSWRTCTILHREKLKLYIHFTDFNRRMDSWVNESELAKVSPETGALPGKLGSKEKSSGSEVVEFVEEEYGQNAEMDEESIREHEEVTKVKNVSKIELGRHIIRTWYFSPIPKEFYPSGGPVDVLYMSEFSLDFYRTRTDLIRHYSKSPPRHPPGDEIYRDEDARVAMFELDGAKSKIYCQNLCYLAKLFLDHKTLYYDVDPFLFYVMCEYDENGYHVCGECI